MLWADLTETAVTEGCDLAIGKCSAGVGNLVLPQVISIVITQHPYHANLCNGWKRFSLSDGSDEADT